MVTGAKNVVDVEIVPHCVEFGNDIIAHFSLRLVQHLIKTAIMKLSLIILLFVDEGVPESHLECGGISIILPVGDAISYENTFERRQENIWIIEVGLDVAVHLMHEVWHIDSGIRLTRDV